MKNIRSELFFLKQFGFSNTLLQEIFYRGCSPESSIFDDKHVKYNEIESFFSKRDIILTTDKDK